MSTRRKAARKVRSLATSEAFYPVVCTQGTASAAAVAARGKLHAGTRRIALGPVAFRTYAGYEKVTQVLDVLDPPGSGAMSEEYVALREAALQLGEQAVLIVASRKVRAPGTGEK